MKLATKRRWMYGCWLALVLWSPGLAYACPVCFSAKDDANRLAFLGTTVFLTALPLILIGLFIGWIARRAQQLESEALGAEPAASAPAPLVAGRLRAGAALRMMSRARRTRVEPAPPTPEPYAEPR